MANSNYVRGGGVDGVGIDRHKLINVAHRLKLCVSYLKQRMPSDLPT